MKSLTGEWQRRPTEDVKHTTPLMMNQPLLMNQPKHGYLVRLGGGDEAGQRVRVDGTLLIGRSDEVDLQLRASDVSRTHARITLVADADFMIEDLNSRNGVLVNGSPTRMRVLRFGDIVHFGARSAFIFTHHNPAEQHTIEAERLEGVAQLAGGIAHHINNLLSVMLSNLGFVEDQTPDTPLGDELVVESLTDMRSAVGRASSIVRQLLSYARQRSQRAGEVDLSSLLEEIVGELRRRTAGARIEALIEPGLIFAGDGQQLRTMFENLGDNALEATREGVIMIGARRHAVTLAEALRHGIPSVGPSLEIWVHDSGEGMDSETRERAFEPFFSTKGPTRGTGLGLAAVHGIVKAHGGFARVESEPGRGTQIWIYLPLPGAREHTDLLPAVEGVTTPRLLLAAAAAPLADRLLQAASSRGIRFAVVEDARQLVMRYLEQRAEIDRVLVDASILDVSTGDALALLRRSETPVQITLLSEQGAPLNPAEADEVVSIGDVTTPEALADRLFGPNH